MCSFKRFACGIVIFILGVVAIYYSIMFLSDSSSKTMQDISSKNRYESISNDNIDRMNSILDMVSSKTSIIDVEGEICKYNGIVSCSDVLNVDRLIDKKIEDKSVNYFNTYAYSILSDKYYAVGDYRAALDSIEISLFYAENLSGIDDYYSRMLVIKYAGIVDNLNGLERYSVD